MSTGYWNIGDVRYPDLFWPVRDNIFDQVRIFPQPVFRVGGDSILASFLNEESFMTKQGKELISAVLDTFYFSNGFKKIMELSGADSRHLSADQ